VKWIDKVLDVALERQPTPLPDEDTKVEAKPEAKEAASAVSNEVLKH
jgi:ATP-dependent Lon protease